MGKIDYRKVHEKINTNDGVDIYGVELCVWLTLTTLGIGGDTNEFKGFYCIYIEW